MAAKNLANKPLLGKLSPHRKIMGDCTIANAVISRIIPSTAGR